jgi:hypothetical protein
LVGTVKVVAATGSTITIPAAESPWDIDALAITHVALASGATHRIVAGPRECTLRSTQKFYLPGYTTGVPTGADVPLVTTYTDPLGWFQAVLDWVSSATIYRAIAASDLGPWRGPILTQTIEEIQLADAIETRAVSA